MLNISYRNSYIIEAPAARFPSRDNYLISKTSIKIQSVKDRVMQKCTWRSKRSYQVSSK